MVKATQYLLIFLLSSFIQGCSLSPHYDQLMALKRLGASQNEMNEYVKKQEDDFRKLKVDIENKELKRGSSKNHVFSRYGKAVFCKVADDKAPAKQVCIYRLPGNGLDAGLIYLYFNGKNRLDSWDIVK